MKELVDYLSDPVNILDELVGIKSSLYRTEITQEVVDAYKKVAYEIMQTPLRRDFEGWLGLLLLVVDEQFWQSEPVKVQNRVASLWSVYKFRILRQSKYPEIRSIVLFIDMAAYDFWKSKGLDNYVRNAAITHDTRFRPWQRRKLLK